MAWKMIRPGFRKRAVTKKTDEAQRVLDALEDFLRDGVDEPIKWLVAFWGEQAAAITYKELREAIEEDDDPVGIADRWFQDYSKLLGEKITPMWESAFLAGAKSNPVFEGIPEFQVNTSQTNVRNWLTTRTGELITACTDEQIKAVRYVIAEARSKGLGSAETARYIRPIIGLTDRQAAANLKFYTSVKDRLREDHPRMTDESIERKARDAAAKYAGKQQRYRAEMIARTENAYAYNFGNDEAIRQAQEKGYLPKMKKVWSTSQSGNVCPACEDLEGTEIDMDSSFSARSGRKTITVELPPLHPNCMCAVIYEETGEEVDY